MIRLAKSVVAFAAIGLASSSAIYSNIDKHDISKLDSDLFNPEFAPIAKRSPDGGWGDIGEKLWNSIDYSEEEEIVPDGDNMVHLDLDSVPIEIQAAGDVHGFVTVNPKSPYHLKVIMTRKDGSLSLESDGSKPLEAVILDEFGIMFQADPLRVVKIADDGEMGLVETLYLPTVQWHIDERRVLTRNGESHGYICPMSNGGHQLYWFESNVRCSGGWPVLLMAADLKTVTNAALAAQSKGDKVVPALA